MSDPTPPSSSSRVRGAQVEDAFPTPPRGQTPDPSFRINGRMSPAPAKFLSMQRAQSTPPDLLDNSHLRTSGREQNHLPTVKDLEQNWSQTQLSKKRSQYYSEAFAYREPHNTAKDRVVRDSIILAEVKLNCCIDSEQEFLIDLSIRLSEIYRRPESCIMVMVATDISMVVGGSREPAYYMAIAALPPEIAATKNKRSAYLVQQFMQEALQISPQRGVVRYESVAEENLATNGMTALQEIEQLERQSHDEESTFRTFSRQKSRRSKRSSHANPSERGKAPTPLLRSATPSVLTSETKDSRIPRSTGASITERLKMKHRKSIFGLFKRKSIEALKE